MRGGDNGDSGVAWAGQAASLTTGPARGGPVERTSHRPPAVFDPGKGCAGAGGWWALGRMPRRGRRARGGRPVGSAAGRIPRRGSAAGRGRPGAGTTCCPRPERAPPGVMEAGGEGFAGSPGGEAVAARRARIRSRRARAAGEGARWSTRPSARSRAQRASARASRSAARRSRSARRAAMSGARGMVGSISRAIGRRQAQFQLDGRNSAANVRT